jgi:hypothetical protein
VTYVVKVDGVLDPAKAGLLSATGMLFPADGITDSIQELLGGALPWADSCV